MGPINLDVLDAPMVEQTQFGDDMKRWLSNFVDIVNASFNTLNNAFANLIGVGGTDAGGGGAGPISVTATGLTSSGFVYAKLVSSSNPVKINSVAPGTNSFTVTFSADPGAHAIITYQVYSAKPQ